MKKKLIIVLLIVAGTGFVFPSMLSVRAEGTETIITPTSSELPSSSYLRTQKSSFATSNEAIVTSAAFGPRTLGGWNSVFAGKEQEWDEAFNVGSPAPLGDAASTLPIALSLLLLYFVSKGLRRAVRRKTAI